MCLKNISRQCTENIWTRLTQFPSRGQHGQVGHLWFVRQIFMLVPVRDSRPRIYWGHDNMKRICKQDSEVLIGFGWLSASFWLQAFRVRWSWPRLAKQCWSTSRTSPLSPTASARWGSPTGNTLKVRFCSSGPLVSTILFLCGSWLTDSHLHSRWHESVKKRTGKELKELF